MSNLKLVSIPEHGDAIVGGNGLASPAMRQFITELELKLNGAVFGDALSLQIYLVADVPDATIWTGAMIFVSDETGGSIPAFSDGTSWRRVTDRTVIS